MSPKGSPQRANARNVGDFPVSVLLCECVQGLTDLITETEDGVSPMTYIRSLYPRDWDHFLERMAARLAGIEPSAVRSP